MKRGLCFLLSCLLMITPVFASEDRIEDVTPQAASSILVDAATGEILAEKQSSERLYPASMTKMMSLLLVFEALHEGRIGWDDEVTASDHVASIGGSQIYLSAREVMSIRDLMKASAIASANDAITALAEKVAGSEAVFVSMMNRKAEELQLQQTHFVNPTGLHDDQHYSCAKDMAVIARELIKEGGQELLDLTKTYDDYIRQDTDQKFWLVNTNKMIRTYQGMDGLKTGYTSQAHYCITVTAQREGLRLIGVVMKEPTRGIRNQEAAALLDYGFSHYAYQPLMKSEEVVDRIRISNGNPDEVDLVVKKEIGKIISKGQPVTVTDREIRLNSTVAPVSKGETAGQIILHCSDGTRVSGEMIYGQDVQPVRWMERWMTTVRKMIF